MSFLPNYMWATNNNTHTSKFSCAFLDMDDGIFSEHENCFLANARIKACRYPFKCILHTNFMKKVKYCKGELFRKAHKSAACQRRLNIWLHFRKLYQAIYVISRTNHVVALHTINILWTREEVSVGVF